jgi:hypothetical protein
LALVFLGALHEVARFPQNSSQKFDLVHLPECNHT